MSYQLELRHLRYFLAVAEDLHFRKAAERLYISQPGLSRQIREMEEGLGFQLFERHSRKVTLTRPGLFLRDEFKNHFKAIENSIQQAKLLDDGLLGDLKFGYVGSAIHETIPRLLLAFREKRPNVLFSLKEMDNQKQVQGLLSFDLDIGFVRLERVPKGLQIQPVLQEPFCLVLPEGHPINATNFKSMDQLAGESYILFDPKYSPSYYEKVVQIFDDASFTPIVTHNTIHADSIYKLVENNFGISIVPKSLRFKHLTGVKFIELNRIPQRTVLSAVWNEDNRNPVMRSFVEEIRNIETKEG